MISERSNDVIIPQGESRVIIDLNYLGQCNRYFILYAYYIDGNGEIIVRTNEILDIERNMKFSEELSLITFDQLEFASIMTLTKN